ncbi:MAG: methionyl-tRNA formyltransferase [Candidatus Eremiobacteraeota bacterium]|nr:methionyl-tRNA formyltransferase [Candidatus Eremiobacteraeota bacterium]
MKTLFFGTSGFAVPSLHVAAAQTELFGVVTQPDRPSGRGHKVRATPVKTAALGLGVRVFEPASLRAFARDIADRSFDLFLLASYGKILPKVLLDIPKLGALNVHPSLLPKYRGATPIQTALRNGDRRTGVTIMLMDAGMDTGDIVLQESLDIAPDEGYEALHDRLAFYGGDLLGQAIDRASRGALFATPQSGERSVTRPLGKDDLVVDLTWPAQRIVNAVRAFSPKPAARAEMHGEMVKLIRAHVSDDGGVVIDELIAPNRGRMSGKDFERSARSTVRNRNEQEDD